MVQWGSLLVAGGESMNKQTIKKPETKAEILGRRKGCVLERAKEALR